jgi:hypothetical protein
MPEKNSDLTNWPSREEWAKRRTTYYGDHDGNVVCSRRLADYATPGEAAAARQALLELWRSLGREMREAKAAAGSEADRARRLDDCRYRRHTIRRVLRETLDAGLVPWRVNDIGSLDDVPSSFALLVERYRAGWDAAEEAYAAEIATTPVDDAAWQAELERRAGIDRRFDERDRAAAAA